MRFSDLKAGQAFFLDGPHTKTLPAFMKVLDEAVPLATTAIVNLTSGVVFDFVGDADLVRVIEPDEVGRICIRAVD